MPTTVHITRPQDIKESRMSTWTNDELQRIADADELEIAPVRRNGELRRATPIWVVRAGDELYVRAAYGANKGWHGVARTSHRARIAACGIERDVTVEDAARGVLDAVDAAYRDKYGRYPSYVEPMVRADARATTLKLIPAGRLSGLLCVRPGRLLSCQSGSRSLKWILRARSALVQR
jgi:hypothetical protein